MTSRLSFPLVLALCACSPAAERSPPPETPAPAPAVNAPAPAPDRTPVSEAPFTPESAQGAANVVQTYFALLEAGRHEEARLLWSDGGRAADRGAADFAAVFAQYDDYHAEIFAPGEIEGAAGSLYVEVPVRIYGRRIGGGAFGTRGTIALRRVNDVPGATAAQRRWHIMRSSAEPSLP